MRDLIEPLRSGQSFQPIEDHMRKDQYRGPDWSCLRGEGPVDYLVRSEGGTPTEALLTFVVGGRYCELMLKDGAVKTGVAQGQTSSVAPGANMAQTVAPDTQVLRRAIFILLGVPTKLSHLTQPMLDAAVASLSRDGKIVAA
jgi:hypothetical protein